MPMFSLGSLSSMTSNKILKTPVIRNSKQVWYPFILDINLTSILIQLIT